MLASISEYFSAKLTKFGTTPMGVDWNGLTGQIVRFKQLSKIIQNTQLSHDGITVNDLGCGYAALYDYLSPIYPVKQYCGIDITESMIEAATKRLAGRTNIKLSLGNSPENVMQYSMASGIFNLKLENSISVCNEYIYSTIDMLDKFSELGFSFNCLTKYSDKEKMKDYLYYADPLKLFNYCKTKFSRNVALLHDYDLYEFTILVRK